MITAKQEANNLVNDMIVDFSIDLWQSKECAKKAVEKILDEHRFDDTEYAKRRYEYWEKVKEELEKM